MLEKIPARLKVIRHVRPKISCRLCGTILQAPSPDLPIEKGRPGPSVATTMMLLVEPRKSPLLLKTFSAMTFFPSLVARSSKPVRRFDKEQRRVRHDCIRGAEFLICAPTKRSSLAPYLVAARAQRGSDKPRRPPACGCDRARRHRPSFLFSACSFSTMRRRNSC